MTKSEAKNWLSEFTNLDITAPAKVVIFPPFTLLDFVFTFVQNRGLSISIGAQNISEYDEGAYTGETNALQIKEFASYILIGHSERRERFFESEEVVRAKVEKAASENLLPIICISNYEQARDLEFASSAIFAYEPLDAIGTGRAEDTEKVKGFVDKFKATFQNKLIYGGSVDSSNVKNYLSIEGVEGVLVGGESLDPHSFGEIINAI